MMKYLDKVKILFSDDVPQPDLIHVGKEGTIQDTVDNWAYVEGNGWGVWYPMSSLSLINIGENNGWIRA